ncbi:MAG: hypothetical protein MI741_22760, partial [Rhodospirillales bacterium]|nr:hypothetical protein [Rhodospirillales bacterium]
GLVYVDSQEELWLATLQYGSSTATAQPLLGGVTACTFSIDRRRDGSSVWVLNRGSIDLTVEADDDSTLDVENFELPPIRVVATTMPRKLE